MPTDHSRFEERDLYRRSGDPTPPVRDPSLLRPILTAITVGAALPLGFLAVYFLFGGGGHF